MDATRKAVESFSGGLWLIRRRDKEGDFGSLADALAGRVRELLLIGGGRPRFALSCPAWRR